MFFLMLPIYWNTLFVYIKRGLAGWVPTERPSLETIRTYQRGWMKPQVQLHLPVNCHLIPSPLPPIFSQYFPLSLSRRSPRSLVRLLYLTLQINLTLFRPQVLFDPSRVSEVWPENIHCYLLACTFNGAPAVSTSIIIMRPDAPRRPDSIFLTIHGATSIAQLCNTCT